MKWSGLFLASLLCLSLDNVHALQSDQDLANRFRPLIKSSMDDEGHSEPYHPVTWQWYVTRAQMTFSRGGGRQVAVPTNGWDSQFAFLTSKGSDLSERSASGSNIGLELPLDTKAYPDAKTGEDWPSVFSGDGVYAHVERVGPPPNAGAPDNRQINIDYTIIWANNAGRANFNQHDADITFVVVLYDPQSDRIVRVTYPAHGCIVQLYELIPGQTVQAQTLAGKDVNNVSQQTPAVRVNVARKNIGNKVNSALCNILGAYQRSGNNYFFLVADPTSPDPRLEHPAVYAEIGTHESWPNSSGSIIGGGGHGGSGRSWLPTTVTLLGSFQSPTSGNEPFLHYNGKFGTDSASLVLHRTWCWPNNPLWPANNFPNGECTQNNAYIPDGPAGSPFSDLNPYENHESTKWPQVVAAGPGDYYAIPTRATGSGSPTAPFGGMDVALTFVPAGSVLHVAPGSYPAILVTKALTMQTDTGPVLIGQ